MDKNNQTFLCPCCSGLNYHDCCKPFHQGGFPQTALALMRSRFSAYALNIPSYIIETTHPASSQYHSNHFNWKRKISQFSKNTDFEKLTVLDFKEAGAIATVTFTASIFQDNQDATFTEKSYFEKRGHRWFYGGGLIESGHAPNLVTTHPLRQLPLAYYGDPILRKKAKAIKEITDDIKQLAYDMIETMEACDGAGLAAPQVHHSIRMFVISPPVETTPGNFEKSPPTVLINPVISVYSEEKCMMPEGCLSIPTIRGAVERPSEITITYTNLIGQEETKHFSGWQARVILHEFDHIDGVLFIDRLKSEDRKKIDPILRELKKRIHDGLAF